jgi:hypothetical protein
VNGILKNLQTSRFNNIKLNENATSKTSDKTYSALKPEFNNPQKLEGRNLLIFENSLSFEIR